MWRKGFDAGATIFALSSGKGKAGVSLVRVSGPQAHAAVTKLLGPSTALPPPRRAAVRTLYDYTGQVLDEALVVSFKGPHSFTGDDVVELGVHGSVAVVRDTLETLERGGLARPAEPGEFTRQAFHHGKLELTAVEALSDLVAAETTAQRRQAVRQLQGELGLLYNGWQNEVLRALAHVNALIDFGDDERLDAGEKESKAASGGDLERKARESMEKVCREAQHHLDDARRGERVRGGVSVCVGGKVNVGKSSLVNRLAQRQLSIVSPHAGTTRDVLETALDIGGYAALLTDTAGVRDSSDAVERMGVELAVQRFADADIRVHVTDSDADAADVLGATTESDRVELVVRNKCDDVPCALPADSRLVVLSCETGEGVDAFVERLAKILEQEVGGGHGGQEWPALTRERHRRHVELCVAALRGAVDMLDVDLLLAGEELRRALDELAGLTGQVVETEDVFDVIFAEFCVGK